MAIDALREKTLRSWALNPIPPAPILERKEEMKKLVKVEDKVYSAFKKLGLKCIGFGHKNANGPDCYAVGENISYKVEIKTVKKMTNGALQVLPVEKNRINDDLIAIVINDYVLIEPMKDHLKLCSKQGYRAISGLRSL